MKVAVYFVFEKTTGSGTRLSNLLCSFVVLLLTITAANWSLADTLGLSHGSKPVTSFADAFYFSSVTITTLGFGDITPSTPLGRVIVSVQAILGLVLLATVSSTLYRRIST